MNSKGRAATHDGQEVLMRSKDNKPPLHRPVAQDLYMDPPRARCKGLSSKVQLHRPVAQNRYIGSPRARCRTKARYGGGAKGTLVEPKATPYARKWHGPRTSFGTLDPANWNGTGELMCTTNGPLIGHKGMTTRNTKPRKVPKEKKYNAMIWHIVRGE